MKKGPTNARVLLGPPRAYHYQHTKMDGGEFYHLWASLMLCQMSFHWLPLRKMKNRRCRAWLPTCGVLCAIPAYQEREGRGCSPEEASKVVAQSRAAKEAVRFGAWPRDNDNSNTTCSAVDPAGICGRYRPGVSFYAPLRSNFSQICSYSPRFHEEIEDFLQFIEPTATENRVRMSLVARIKKTILSAWPQAKVELFGSVRAGLYLPQRCI